MSGDTCFLNQFRGLDLQDTTEAGIDPSSFLSDTTAGNVFHGVLLAVGFALTFAGRRLAPQTLFVVGFITAGPFLFLLISEAMKQVPTLYNCYLLGGGSLVGATLFGLYVSRVLGEEGVFQLLGLALGLLGGYFAVMLVVVHVPETGIEVMGRDLNQLAVVLACAFCGYVLIGKVEYIRRNGLMIFSAAAGSLMLVSGVDYLLVAHLGGSFRPTVSNPGTTNGAPTTLAALKARGSFQMLAAAGTALVGYYIQIVSAPETIGGADGSAAAAAGRADPRARARGPPRKGPPPQAYRDPWQQTRDPSTGEVYYFNAQTGETSWDPYGTGGGGGAYGDSYGGCGEYDDQYDDPYGSAGGYGYDDPYGCNDTGGYYSGGGAGGGGYSGYGGYGY